MTDSATLAPTGAPSDPAEVEATRAFVTYAIAYADR